MLMASQHFSSKDVTACVEMAPLPALTPGQYLQELLLLERVCVSVNLEESNENIIYIRANDAK